MDIALNKADIPQLEAQAFWSDMDWLDNLYPTRTLFLSLEDEGLWYSAEAVSFSVKGMNDFTPITPAGETYKLCFIPNDTDSLIVQAFPYEGVISSIPFQAIQIPLSALPVPISHEGKYFWAELKGSETSEEVKQLCKKASLELKRLEEIQKSKGYKPGWIYHQFCNYQLKLLREQKVLFRSDYKGNSDLKRAARAFPVIPGGSL